MKYVLPCVLALAAGAAFAEDMSGALSWGSSGAQGGAPVPAPLGDPPWITQPQLFRGVAGDEEDVTGDERDVASDDDVVEDAEDGMGQCPVYAGSETGTESAEMPDDEIHAGAALTAAAAYDPGAADSPHQHPAPSADMKPIALGTIPMSTAPNGHRIQEIFAQRQALAQTAVRVRGQVVKLTEGILGRSYVHLRDGSGSRTAGDDDLTVTTTEPCAVGDTLELEGTLRVDQDSGIGYVYPARLDDAVRIAAADR